MTEKESSRNQFSPISPGLQPALARPGHHNVATGRNGGARPGAGRPKGVPNKVTQTFRDLIMQAASEVGDSREEGEDGHGGVLGYLKKAAIREEKTFLLMMARILPMKVTSEVKHFKERISIEEAVAELKACGLDEMLAAYLKRYPLEPEEMDEPWAKMIDMSMAPEIDMTPETAPQMGGNGTASDTDSKVDTHLDRTISPA
jgi:hypothetical protein